MYDKFSVKLDYSQIRNKLRNTGLTTGLGRGARKGFNNRACHLGSERISRGFVIVKVAEPDIWKRKHNIIWENVNGKIPSGHKLIFADRNRLNVCLDNILLVKNSELLIMNKYGLLHDNKTLTITGLNIARLILKISEARKRK